MKRKKMNATERKDQDPPQDHNVNLTLYILQQIQSGKRPSQIWPELGMKHSAFQYHLNKLKRAGSIRKVGYGTWMAQNENVKSTHVVPNKTPTLRQSNLTFFQSDSVRAHAFLFTLQVPKNLRNWTNENRELFLKKQDIDFVRLKISGSGQRIVFRDRKVWLLNKSVVIYDTASYFAERSIDAKSTALYKFFSLVKGIERLLHTDFSISGDYRFKVSRQHYALVENALAKQYTDEGKKLEIRTDKGLWFLIDNSFNLHEAETVHPITAMTDNKKVQDWFNGLKEQPITPDFVLTVMNGIQQNQLVFAQNIGSHIMAIKKLGQGVEELTKIVEKLQGHRQIDDKQRILGR